MVSVFGNHFGTRYLESDYGYLVSNACTLCAHALRALHIFSPPSTPQGTLASPPLPPLLVAGGFGPSCYLQEFLVVYRKHLSCLKATTHDTSTVRNLPVPVGFISNKQSTTTASSGGALPLLLNNWSSTGRHSDYQTI